MNYQTSIFEIEFKSCLSDDRWANIQAIITQRIWGVLYRECVMRKKEWEQAMKCHDVLRNLFGIPIKLCLMICSFTMAYSLCGGP